MNFNRLIIWTLALCLLMTGASVSAEPGKVMLLASSVDREANVHETPEKEAESFILPSVSLWQPGASGGEKHVRVQAGSDWYVEYCPEWVEMYILQMAAGSYEGRVTWELHSAQSADGAVQMLYSAGADVFLKVGQNEAGEDRQGLILLRTPGGAQAMIRIAQARHVEELSVEIVKPCAEAVDTVMAGYETEIEIRMTNATAGRVEISDGWGEVLYTAEFAGEIYSFDYVFGAGCYVISAEATGDAYVNASESGYVREEITISAYELEYIEEIGVTRQYVEYIKIREGKSNMPYLDAAGNWTIGYGHLISAEAADVYAKQGGWSDEECERQLMEDLKIHADLMRSRLPEEIYEQLTPNQFDALMSMEFNACGRAVSEEFRLGQCLRKLDTVQDYEIVNGFITWHGIHDGEYDLLGLYYRRMEEARIFLYADYSTKYNWPIPWWLNVGSGGKGRSIHEVPSGDSWLTDVMPTLDVSTTLIRSDGAQAIEYVTIESSKAWNISIGEEYPWVSASSYRGSDGSIVQITVEENTGAARHAIVQVSCGAVTRTIHVHQDGAE